jgi:hypothetical protein
VLPMCVVSQHKKLDKLNFICYIIPTSFKDGDVDRECPGKDEPSIMSIYE